MRSYLFHKYLMVTNMMRVGYRYYW